MGKIKTPAGTVNDPTKIILVAKMLEINKQIANKMPANINKTETVFFILLVFYVVFKHTELNLKLSCKGNTNSVNQLSIFVIAVVHFSATFECRIC